MHGSLKNEGHQRKNIYTALLNHSIETIKCVTFLATCHVGGIIENILITFTLISPLPFISPHSTLVFWNLDPNISVHISEVNIHVQYNKDAEHLTKGI